MPPRTSQKLARTVIVGIVVLLASLHAPSARAEDQRFEIGARATLVTAGGEPTNDQMGAGVYGKYRLNEKWLVGGAIDFMSGDFERPYEILGKISPEEIDSTVDSTIFSGWIEREYGKQDRKLKWFWSAGLGFTSPDADDVTGPLAGGGTFDITTDPGSEILVSGAGGLRRGFSRRFGFEFGVRVDQHFADWDLTDRSDGTTGSIDDYTAWGGYFGLRIAF